MAIPPIKTSANLDLSASTGAGKPTQAHANINASAGAQNKNSEAFQQLNQQLGRNNSQGSQNNQTAHAHSEGNQGHGNSAHASMQGNAQVSLRANNGNNGNHNGQHKYQDAASAANNQGNQENNGNHGVNRGSQGAPQSNQNQVGDGGRGNGNGNAYGRAEGGGNGNAQGNGGNNNAGNPLNININFSANVRTGANNQTGGSNQGNANAQATAHANVNNHSTHGNNGNSYGNAQAYGQLDHSSQHGHVNNSTQGNTNYSAPANTQRQSTGLNLNLSLNLNGNGDNGNHNGIVRSVLNQVLRDNDIYLNRNVIRHFVNENFNKPGNGNAYGSKHYVSIPPEITQIVRTIRAQVTNVLHSPQVNFNGNVRINIQHSPELSHLIQSSRNVLLQNFGAKPFVNLNLQARMYIASELILRYLSKSQMHVLLNHSAKQILNGLLLARGFAVTADKFFPRHDIFSAKKFPLPHNVPTVVIRNLGNAVKALIVEARLAQTPKDLEAAVGKFLRGLSGKNNLEALASAVRLAGQLGVKGNVAGETDVPEKIAELVKFLILAGDKALQSVADAFDAAEAELLTAQNADNSANPETTELERNYETLRSGDTVEAEGALRRQLEFNPFFQNERAASAFDNPTEASRAQEEFTNRFHHEIDQWLESGNHRFVKDIELEKPVGIVVERGTSGFFMADKARIVLVRDGSVQGWHFLKSFLVK